MVIDYVDEVTENTKHVILRTLILTLKPMKVLVKQNLGHHPAVVAMQMFLLLRIFPTCDCEFRLMALTFAHDLD